MIEVTLNQEDHSYMFDDDDESTTPVKACTESGYHHVTTGLCFLTPDKSYFEMVSIILVSLGFRWNDQEEAGRPTWDAPFFKEASDVTVRRPAYGNNLFQKWEFLFNLKIKCECTKPNI